MTWQPFFQMKMNKSKTIYYTWCSFLYWSNTQFLLSRNKSTEIHDLSKPECGLFVIQHIRHFFLSPLGWRINRFYCSRNCKTESCSRKWLVLALTIFLTEENIYDGRSELTRSLHLQLQLLHFRPNYHLQYESHHHYHNTMDSVLHQI